MKKWQLALAILIIFSGGFFTGKYVFEEGASREIRVGYQDSGRPDVINFEKVIKNTEDQAAVDNFMMIYMNKEEVAMTDVDLGKPDVFISITSPKQFTGLIDSRIWFREDGGIIARRSGESWDEVEYFSISVQDADYIKDKIEYKAN
ncbi:hypothetical protein ACOJQI_13065 [Bacillus salacetis]|uniref:hypothetical protein n=1 Tax=Bacillus salacetis TaxID=2315464 RepID=UPI003B9DC748